MSLCATLNIIMKTFFHLKKFLMLTNGLLLAIDTLRPLGIWFRTFEINDETLNTISGVVQFLVILNLAGYMVTSCGFDAFIHLRYILYIHLKWSVILRKSPTSNGYFSNSTGSSVMNRRSFLGEITPPYVSWPRAIKICYPILYAIDKFWKYDIFSTYT